MTPKEMIYELTSCYIPAGAKMIERMEALAESIQEDARQDVIDAIMEKEGPSTKIGTAHIVAACNTLGISYRKAHYIPAEDWICDACGHTFKYSMGAGDDDYIDKYIYDFCPMCGFQPGWTQLADAYRRQGIGVEWYDRLLDDCASAFGPKIKPHKARKGGGMTLDRGGIFWKIDDARSERAAEKKIAADAKIAEIDRAKRYDLRDDFL